MLHVEANLALPKQRIRVYRVLVFRDRSLQMGRSLRHEQRFVEDNPKTTKVEFAKALQVNPLTVGRWTWGEKFLRRNVG
jgi:hypothetical protein